MLGVPLLVSFVTPDKAQAQTSCDVTAAKTQATNAYNYHRNNGAGNVATARAAYRVLISLGGTLPAWSGNNISGSAPIAPITEVELRAFTGGQNDTWAGWDPIYTALSCLEMNSSPVVTVTGGEAVSEGTDASFTLTAFPAPTGSLTVNVTVAESEDFVASGDEGTDTVTITTSGTATYTVPTVDDATDEANGSVKVTVNSGTGYTPGSTASATVTVNDNDAAPGIAEPAGHKQPALTATVVNEGANSMIMVRIPDGLGNRVRHFTFGFMDTVTTMGYAPPGASATATGWFDCDAGDLVNANLYTTRARQWNPATGNNDGPWGDVVGTEMRRHETHKRSGEVANVPVTLCPGSEGKTFGLTWTLDTNAPLNESFKHDADNCRDSSVSFARREDTLNSIVYVTPAYTVHQSFRCWTTVTILPQEQGGQPAEQDSQPAQEQPAQVEPAQVEPAQVEPVVEPVCVSAELLADVEGYAAETWRTSADHVPRWSRVLAGFGQSNSYSNNPMTASEAQTYAERSWGSRWIPVTAALQCLETAAAEQAEAESQPAQDPTPAPTTTTTTTTTTTLPPTPVVSVAGGASVSEGGDAVFTVTASPAPTSDLDVVVDVSQTGDYTSATGTRTVTISAASGSATFTVATTDDSTDETDGSVTATVSTGAGYTVSSTSGSVSVVVSDNDNPPPPVSSGPPTVTVADATAVEGQDLTFVVTLSKPNPEPITFRYGGYGRTAMMWQDFQIEYNAVHTLAAGDTQVEIVVPVIDDNTPEATETLRIYVYATSGIVIRDGFLYATGTITDND